MTKKKTIKAKAKSNDVFDNISKSIDIDFDGEEIDEIVEVKNQLDVCSNIMKNEFSLEDSQYIKDQLQSLVSNIDVAMDKMQQDLKIGSTARQNEVFAQLCNAKANALKELINMNKAVLDAKVKLRKNNPKNMTVNNNLNLTSSELLKIVNDAKKNNSLDDIEAKFNIESEKHIGRE